MQSDKDKSSYLAPWNISMSSPSHRAVYFGKLVEVYTTPAEHWCVVHHPNNEARTASWRMPKYRSPVWCAEHAAIQTKDKDYDEGWTATNSEA
jgi:hypothetical protein